MHYCPECGVEIISEDVFCGNCGIALTPIVPIGEDIKNAPISEDEANDENLSGADVPVKSPEESVSAESALPVSDQKKDDLPEENQAEVKKPEEFLMSAPIFTEQPMNDLENSAAAEKKSDSGKQTAENWTMQTASADLPPLSFEIEKDKNADVSASGNLEKNEPNISAEIKPEEPISFSDELNSGDSSALKDKTPNEELSPNDLPPKPVSESESTKTSGFTNSAQLPGSEDFAARDENDIEQKNNSSGLNANIENQTAAETADPDFQATIPYTPTDFSRQKMITPEIADEKPIEKFEPNKLSQSDSEKFAVGENAAPIAPPDIPVGSSPYASLEPTSVSVQIYDPKQRSEDAEPATLLNSSEDVKALVEQAKSAQPQTGQPLSNRAYTSPNISGNDTDGKGKAKLKPLDEGTFLNNRYEVVRKIGGGGMGAVYLASDKNLGGISRAVKEMVQSHIEDAQQEKAVNDFKRESLLLSSLEHPNIPTIYDYFFDEKEARFYLVMKYISGGDLAARLRSAPEGRIEEKVVTEWAIQIADVLDYLHNRQPPIIYRDLKPANIMIDGNSSRVMLIDFGIARWVNKEEKGVTAVGTMGYAPPELFSGNVEPRSDIYSLGSTMFHLLTGADPQSNPLLIFDFQKHPRPRQINPQISDQMEKILMRAVEYNADKRFASAAELRDALVRHLENLRTNKVTFGVKETPSPAAFSDQAVFCGFCGQKIVATDMFCAFCGAKQPLAQKGVQPQNLSAARFTAQLLIVGTNEFETPAFRLEKDENLLGRRDPMSNIFPEIDLSKFDPQTKISRKHARIWREGTNFLVEDLGSSNGTIILSPVKETVRLLPRQPHTLYSGDKIKLGDTTLHFVVA